MIAKKILKNRFLISLAFLFIVYSVGIFLLLTSENKESIINYTPFILSMTLFFLLFNHQGWTKKLIVSLILVFILGFFVEVLGIQTGFPFGSYQYSHVLGLHLFDTPIVMGVNWVLLVYAGTLLLHPLNWPIYLKSILTGLLLVSLDIFLEPFAIQWKLWEWKESIPPLQNYIAWTIIAILFTYLVNVCLEKSMRNKLAPYVLLIQFVFFLLLSN